MAEDRWTLDIWLVVLLCVAAGQLVKLLLYSVPRRRLQLTILGQSAGLPSIHAAVGGCLVTLCVVRLGWQAPETSLATLFAAITVFDAIRVRSAAEQQRRVMRDLVLLAPDASPWRRQVAGYLDMIAHTPVHVASGLIWGFLFAMAVGTT
jgi:acid phosphatase family membrane protein YuiD